ncbi:MAG: AraC family transcriptional regulator [Clostridia bacterium]|nr:AraC family transcriptional regulator [Clostridia bacterium]
MQSVRIVEIPDCKMVLSAPGMFGDGVLERFSDWISMQPRSIWPNDFLFFEGDSFRWAYIYTEGMEIPADCSVADWKGGLYAVATGIDGHTDKADMDSRVQEFIASYGFEADPSRPELGNIITPPAAAEVMNCEQMDYWYPIKKKDLP